MRALHGILAVMLMAAPLSGCFGIGGSGGLFGEEEEKEPLRLNHLQMEGTHNSYHIEPLVSPTREYLYTHEPLNVQAAELGVRQFEIDVWWDVREGLRVYHNQYDSGTTCPTFEDCLSTLLVWSEANDRHHPLMIWVEPKDWPEQAADITTTVELSGILQDIEDEIAEFWPRNRTITPDDVRGEWPSLNEGVLNDGWPLLEESRGKAVFVLLAGGDMRDLYVEDHPGLAGA
ncbi:MAG: Ca2+-dependent phosphoinositide-specific phospholipase C, partial [Candidatus Thermoplasmatota archaeon]|nr:Ca2+-dependent phosphoinositide-specific phospholipase C [Candidatus Thermoplasmatota archaeon]